ncbi:MAG TPA: hypothetical protein EYQ50_06390 [Verrucomicrobiales bacterium]|nr:hypothetical protein [Verrucomicrobiales bacterium]
MLNIESVRTVPYVPSSHPFIERKIGTIRREYLDHVFYWNGADLEKKLDEYQKYFNGHRVHAGIRGITPNKRAGVSVIKIANCENYKWQSQCNGLFEMPIAA